MSKYIKEEFGPKYKMADFFEKATLEFQEHFDEYSKLKWHRAKGIHKALGDVEMTEETFEGICSTFSISECRYGLTCLSSDTIRALFEITEIFPMLTKEAIKEIGTFYIKDLFEEYSLIPTLSVMFHKEGTTDATFEKFMKYTESCADEIDKKYSEGEYKVKTFLREYSYDFVEHFSKFIVKHHIKFSDFKDSLPSPELFLRDLQTLQEVRRTSRECWSSCDPISYTMLEDYWILDPELKGHVEEPEYSYSLIGRKVSAPFTKTEFLEQIKGKQKVLKK